MNISLAVYCEELDGLTKTARFMTKYAACFEEVIVLCNINERVEGIFSEHASRFVLNLQGQINQGAALNKLLAHVTSPRVLLIDAHAHIDQNVLNFIYDINDHIDIQCQYLIGFQTQLASQEPSCDKIKTWKHGLTFSEYLPWGGLFFEPSFLLSIGGFQDQLSNKALMIDLCLRAQQHSAVLLQSQFMVCCHEKERLAIKKDEFTYLQLHYPGFYSNVFQRFIGSWRREQKNQKLFLN